ncbi:MAG TPA: hypothetical protein VGB63_08520 [Pedobacter sp.]|jgi:hypothetical protein
MESFIINHEGKDYTITPALHEGFFKVGYDTMSGMLAKDSNGEWAFHLESSDMVELPASEIGDKINSYLEEQDKHS